MPDKELNIKVSASDQSAAAFNKAKSAALSSNSAFSRLGASARKMAANILSSNTRLGTVARSMVRVGAAASKMGSAVAGAGRGFSKLGSLAGRLGGILRGALTVGIGAAIGGIFGLRAAFGAMREAMEGSGGVGGALADAGEQAQGAASDLSDAADAGEAAVTKIQGVFGAFGRVGEGFIQQQGKMAEETTGVMDAAVSSAQSASDAMEDAQDSIGGATQATSRFGQATDRIANAFQRAKTIILQAIAKAITPALEKFADLLESPTFQKFVDLLAKDLAEAAEKVADWFINDVIPALEDFMEKVNEAGGPVAYLKEKWEGLKKTVLMIIAIILRKLLDWSNSIRKKFGDTIDWIKDKWKKLKDGVQWYFEELGKAVEEIFSGIATTVTGALDTALRAIERALNAARIPINNFIRLFNDVSGAIGGPIISIIPEISLPTLAAGGIIDRPMAAIVGDNPAGEAITPLDKLPGIIREALGDLAGARITVMVPAGTANPQAFGASVGDSMVRQMRAQGLRMPV